MNSYALRALWKDILSIKSALLLIFFSFTYLSLYTFFSNYRLFIHVFPGDYPLSFKLNLFAQFILGLKSALSQIDFVLLIVISIFVGLNFVLIGKTIGKLKNSRLRLSVGGGTILGIVTAGCTTCGLSVLSFFGITSATLGFLPFIGIELNLAAIGLLMFSAVYMLRNLYIVSCRINEG